VLVDKETVRTLVLSNIVKEVLEKSFDDVILSNDPRVYDDIASGVWNIYHQNIARYGKNRRGSRGT
jgi:hypothetical protein